ncbi:MAG: signal peptide peptidase SppA [Prochloraceae cyanobacterium]
MGQFIKQTFASVIGTLIALFLFSALGVTGLVFLIVSAASQTEGVSVKNKSVLVFDLSMSIRDTEPASTLGQALSGQETSNITLRQVIKSLEAATKDRRIVAMFLDGRGATGEIGYATLTEVRAALESFRAAGKKIIAYDDALSEKEYYLSSVADLVALNPLGSMEINGFSSQQLFLTGALEKYGIGVQIIRVGEYKSAVEPFIRKDFSPENRQQTQKLLNVLWGEFISQVGKSRQLTPQKLQEIVDSKALLNSQEAKAGGLIDRVAYLDEVVEEVKEITGVKNQDKSFRSIDLRTYASSPRRNSPTNNSDNKIALVYAQGTIVGGQGDLREIGGDRFAKELAKLRRDQNVKAVVLRINSPGGSATASEVILRAIQLLRKEKPVIVSMGNVTASGGYWISTGADRIFAQPNTITGSIGVFGVLPNIQKLSNKNGITWDAVTTGRFADSGTIARPRTEQELAIYQKYVQQIYEIFLDKVAESRNLPKEKVAQIAQGRIWSGEDAKKIGLVDQIGGLDAAVEYAAEKAGLGNDWEIKEYPRSDTLEERILRRLMNARVEQARQKDPLTSQLLKLKEDLVIWQSFNDPRDVYALLPYKLTIE